MTADIDGIDIDGTVNDGFGAVAEAFARNFAPTKIPDRPADPGDVGAALCVMVGDEVVVDIWGGFQDAEHTRPWERDTLVNAYSTMKPVAGALALMAVDRGELRLDEPLSGVWPELEEHHAALTLRHALSHRASLPAVRQTLPPEAIFDWSVMTAALAQTAPWWPTGSAHGYHTNTFGFLVGEPVCRVTNTDFGSVLQDRIARPYKLDMHVGLHTEDLGRCADIVRSEPAGAGFAFLDSEPTNEAELMLHHTYLNPPGMSGIGVMNSTEWRQAQVPSTNGHATARALAGFHRLMLPSADRPLVSAELMVEARQTQAEGDDRVLLRPARFGLGYMLHQDARPIGTTAAAYGHFGYGGSLGFADPTYDLSVGYVINHPGDRWKNPRVNRIVGALRAIFARQRDAER